MDQEILLGLADDDRLFLDFLQEYLAGIDGFRVTLTAETGDACLAELDRMAHRPHILILDLNMPEGNGLEVLRRLKSMAQPPRVVVMSTMYAPQYVGQLFRLGAHAFLSKSVDRQTLVRVLKEVHHCGQWWSPEQVETLRQQLSPRLPSYHLPSKDGLTKREIEILRLVCQQLSTREIAQELFLSPKTVESHKSNLMMKTAVRNIVGLVIYAIQQQIVHPGEILLLRK